MHTGEIFSPILFSMCLHKRLYYDEQRGYVVHCEECNTIQIAFGNLLVTFCRPDFFKFVQWMGEENEKYADAELIHTRNIILPTPCEGMKMMMSRAELNDLHGMLDAAEAELSALEMMRLF